MRGPAVPRFVSPGGIQFEQVFRSEIEAINELSKIVATHPEWLPAPLVAEQLRGSGKPGFVDALSALLYCADPVTE